ncbi:MAG TPA: cation diffusion facilitator family transporter [Longimicrobiales bacterium]|nr:cation diffusion facilitator family transporter [Longimicrobiales bacterium]
MPDTGNESRSDMDHGHHHRDAHDHEGDAHDHAHDDDHPHDHDHAHDYREIGRRRLMFVLSITALFMVVEFVGGWISNSLALMADAGHMLSDVAALGLSAFALWFSRRPATPAKTYGYMRIEILAALVNGATLIVISLIILWQAWTRFREPQNVEGTLMLGVATAGLLVNIIAAFLLHSSSSHNLNLRGAYLHVLGDLLGSVGAIAAALIILSTGWMPADPIISVIVALLILGGAWRLVRESVDVLLEAVPRHIDMSAVEAAIRRIPGVEEVHDLHVWTLTSGFLAMSGHALITDPARHQETIGAVHDLMHREFGISHVTIQVDHKSIVALGRKGTAREG